jgi:hypothetical protein
MAALEGGDDTLIPQLHSTELRTKMLYIIVDSPHVSSEDTICKEVWELSKDSRGGAEVKTLVIETCAFCAFAIRWNKNNPIFAKNKNKTNLVTNE